MCWGVRGGVGKCVGVCGEVKDDERRGMVVWKSVGEVSGECKGCKKC